MQNPATEGKASRNGERRRSITFGKEEFEKQTFEKSIDLKEADKSSNHSAENDPYMTMTKFTGGFKEQPPRSSAHQFEVYSGYEPSYGPSKAKHA